MDLNDTDKKLLAYLYHSNREYFTKIAKATGLSREQVDYKINNYLKEGVIKNFATIFNYSKLGYPYFTILLIQFEAGQSSIFTSNLKNNPNCISFGKVLGKYDLYLNLVFRNELELKDYLTKILNKETGHILDYLLIKPYFVELYPLKFLHNKNQESNNFTLISPNEKMNFDKVEIAIMKLLERDGRLKLIDISRKLNISSELALYKIRKLYASRVILGSRIKFNMDKLGYFFTVILLRIKDLSERNINHLRSFARNSNYVNSFALSLNNPNCFIQLFHKTEQELRDTLFKLRGELKHEPFEMEILLISEEEELNTLPIEL